MTQFRLNIKKDLGLHEEVMEAYPTAVVGGAWTASFITATNLYTSLVHIVPTGHQLKVLFLRVWTQNAGGARFSIVQSNPTIAGQTGAVEAFPAVGSVPPYTAGLTAVRDYPFLEADGAEILQGSLEAPVHVFEGSVIWNVLGILAPLGGARYGIVWWGVQESQKR